MTATGNNSHRRRFGWLTIIVALFNGLYLSGVCGAANGPKRHPLAWNSKRSIAYVVIDKITVYDDNVLFTYRVFNVGLCSVFVNEVSLPGPFHSFSGTDAAGRTWHVPPTENFISFCNPEKFRKLTPFLPGAFQSMASLDSRPLVPVDRTAKQLAPRPKLLTYQMFSTTGFAERPDLLTEHQVIAIGAGVVEVEWKNERAPVDHRPEVIVPKVPEK